jgi:peptidoglycan/xylan/chitin deacetylase (PgdA/CDA1 family)
MRSIDSNRLFEFAQHGYTHKANALGRYPLSSEFDRMPYAIQYNTIRHGRDDIKQAFGVTPTTFLPPFDKGDDNTLRAAKALGFTKYCTSFQDFSMNQGSRDGIKVESVSLVLTNESLQSAESKTEQFLNDPHTIDTFVVLYHPADFSGPNGVVNPDKVKLLSDYIDYLKGKKDVVFTKLDRSWTVAGGGAGNRASDIGNMQQGAIVLPNGMSIDVSGIGNLIGGLNGSAVFLLVGAILVLSVGSYLIVFRKRGG